MSILGDIYQGIKEEAEQAYDSASGFIEDTVGSIADTIIPSVNPITDIQQLLDPTKYLINNLYEDIKENFPTESVLTDPFETLEDVWEWVEGGVDNQLETLEDATDDVLVDIFGAGIDIYEGFEEFAENLLPFAEDIHKMTYDEFVDVFQLDQLWEEGEEFLEMFSELQNVPGFFAGMGGSEAGEIPDITEQVEGYLKTDIMHLVRSSSLMQGFKFIKDPVKKRSIKENISELADEEVVTLYGKIMGRAESVKIGQRFARPGELTPSAKNKLKFVDPEKHNIENLNQLSSVLDDMFGGNLKGIQSTETHRQNSLIA